MDLKRSAFKAAAIGIIVPLLIFLAAYCVDRSISSFHAPVNLNDINRGTYTYPTDFKQPVIHYFSYLVDSLNINISGAIQKKKEGSFKQWTKPGTDFNLGLYTSNIWFYLKLQNDDSHENCFVWQMFFNRDSVQLYCVNDSDIYGHLPVGYHSSLHERSLPIRAVFDTVWLGPGKSIELYMKVPRHYYNTYIPMQFLPLSDLLMSENNTSAVYAGYMAIIAFVFVLNIFLFLLLRRIIHIWYSLYILNIIILFLLSSLYAALVLPDGLYRALSAAESMPFGDFALFCMGRVMQLFLEQNPKNSLFYRPLSILLAADLVWGVLQLSVCNAARIYHFDNHFTLFRSVNDILVWLTLFLFDFSMIEKILQRQRFAPAYFCISLFPLLGLMTSFLNSLGIVSITPFYHLSFFTGILLEIVFLTFLLARSYSVIQEEKEELLYHQLGFEKAMNRRIAEVQENEQRRIAADLHDGLGSSLTGVRIMVNNAIHFFTAKNEKASFNTLLKVQQELDKSISEVRNIALNLMPKDFEQYGFAETIKKYLDDISTQARINAEYSIDEEMNDLDKQFQVVLFRLFAELTSNALKHSGCSNFTVQFSRFDQIIQLMVEDDGEGFEASAKHTGMGLGNVVARVESLGGTLHIDSGAGGTTVIIEIPYN